MIKVSKGGQLKNHISMVDVAIPRPTSEEFQQVDGFIIGKQDNQWMAYDRVCDHNGGKLCLNKDKSSATCPIHQWTLMLNKGSYQNGIKKQSYHVTESEERLSFQVTKESFPDIDVSKLNDEPMEFFFNAHASCSLQVADFNLITDPWLIGSCFATGWWHAHPTSEEAIERLQTADLIYISHNHPDHLHMPTLKKYVSKEAKFLIPNFSSKSVESLMKREGYNNLIIADFLEEVLVETNNGKLKLMLVKSGDDRDDSSLLVFNRRNSAFFGVDTNMPNKWVLPKVDLLFTAFASGATGFPVRCDNYTDEQKSEMTNKNKKSFLPTFSGKLMKATKPTFVVPYAGYFTEKHRDQDVNKINHKNNADDFIKFVEKHHPSIKAINPLKTPNFTINNKKIDIDNEKKNTPFFTVNDEYIDHEISEFTKGSPMVNESFLKKLGQKFVNSEFRCSLTVVIIPTNDQFELHGTKFLMVDFSNMNRTYIVSDASERSHKEIAENLRFVTSNNIEVLRIRQDSLSAVFHKGLPIEDLSIGFQARMYREPNVYNFEFWDYFTNHEILRLEKQSENKLATIE